MQLKCASGHRYLQLIWNIFHHLAMRLTCESCGEIAIRCLPGSPFWLLGWSWVSRKAPVSDWQRESSRISRSMVSISSLLLWECRRPRWQLRKEVGEQSGIHHIFLLLALTLCFPPALFSAFFPLLLFFLSFCSFSPLALSSHRVPLLSSLSLSSSSVLLARPQQLRNHRIVKYFIMCWINSWIKRAPHDRWPLWFRSP